ncbi:MAG: FtsX-like permease family protein [Candidatus Aminicenantes bacterium]|nr:MAG: FtsX-like permease family protein [Candidatus Aminicenantes bacterium]
MAVVFFLNNDLSEEEVTSIGENLKKSSLSINVRFISSQQALKKFQENFPDLQRIIENLKINPFPPSFEVTLSEKKISSEETFAFIEEMREMQGIEDVQFNRDWAEKIQSLSRLVKAVGFFFGGILILASFFIISNVIKLNVLTRKDEIEILRLVGASNTFIRVPFLMEGVILGIFGGLLSLFLLFLLINLFPVYLGASMGFLEELINFRYLSMTQSLILIAGGAVIGFLGSSSSLARFMKI